MDKVTARRIAWGAVVSRLDVELTSGSFDDSEFSDYADDDDTLQKLHDAMNEIIDEAARRAQKRRRRSA